MPGWPGVLAAAGAGAYLATNAKDTGVGDYVRGIARVAGVELPSSVGGSAGGGHGEVGGNVHPLVVLGVDQLVVDCGWP